MKRSTNNEGKQRRRAVVYLRARGETPEETKELINDQRLACRTMARMIGADVVAEFNDERLSAIDPQRPGLIALLRRIEDDPTIDVLIVIHEDRLARDAGLVGYIIHELTVANVKLYSRRRVLDEFEAPRSMRSLDSGDDSTSRSKAA